VGRRVRLGGFGGVVHGVGMVPVSGMCVVCRLLVVTGFMMLRSLMVVTRGVLMVLCCLLVVMRCFLRHG
jgi:hypothetical protein